MKYPSRSAFHWLDAQVGLNCLLYLGFEEMVWKYIHWTLVYRAWKADRVQANMSTSTSLDINSLNYWILQLLQILPCCAHTCSQNRYVVSLTSVNSILHTLLPNQLSTLSRLLSCSLNKGHDSMHMQFPNKWKVIFLPSFLYTEWLQLQLDAMS